MTPYEVLGVSTDAGAEATRAAYVHAARTSHPDQPGGSDLAMQRVNEAWAVLSDPARKADFDLTYRRAQEAGQRRSASRFASGSANRARPRGAARPNMSGTKRVRTQESAPPWSPPPPDPGHASLAAMAPLLMLVIGGLLAMAGAAFGFNVVFVLGLIIVLLGGFGLLLVPMVRLSESRRADGPQ